MRRRIQSLGFSIIELVIVIVIIAVIGLLAVVAYSRMQEKPISKTDTASELADASENGIGMIPSVSSAEELDAAIEALDQVDFGSETDTQQLDSQASAF